MVVDASGALRDDVGLQELPDFLADRNSLVWCDIYSLHGGQKGPYGRILSEVFGFDALTIEDCFTRSHLPKVDVYEDYLFMALFSFHLSEKTRRVQTVEVDMYVGENYVVCVHRRPLRELDRVRRRLLAENEFVASSPANVAHTVFDAVVDEYLPIMNRLSAMVDGIEDDLLSEGEASDQGHRHDRHHARLPGRLAGHLHHPAVGRINQSMQRLTAISLIFLPLTFITGIYGMNFAYMPETHPRLGFYAVLTLCALVGGGMLYYLRRKRML